VVQGFSLSLMIYRYTHKHTQRTHVSLAHTHGTHTHTHTHHDSHTLIHSLVAHTAKSGEGKREVIKYKHHLTSIFCFTIQYHHKHGNKCVTNFTIVFTETWAMFMEICYNSYDGQYISVRTMDVVQLFLFFSSHTNCFRSPNFTQFSSSQLHPFTHNSSK
jgi:hypothetical protein